MRLQLIPVDFFLGVFYIAAWLILGWSRALRSGLEAYTTNPWLLVMGYLAIFGAGYYLIGLPLAYYRGFVLPHHFGQSNQSLPGWVVEQVKSLPIGLLLGGLVFEVVYAILRAYPQTWWLWVAGFLLVFNVLLTNLSPALLMPLFNKFVPISSERVELAERLVRLANRAGASVQGVYQYDASRRTKAASAALAGLWGTRRIILGDTLLEKFPEDEIEVVVAHELGHEAHHDIPVGILFESVLTLVGLYLASIGLNRGVAIFGFNGLADIAALPVVAAVFGIYELLTMPLFNSYSRWRERRADRYAVDLTGNGRALASAFTRLANQNLADIDPPRWVEFFLHSHPALCKRIASASQSARSDPTAAAL